MLERMLGTVASDFQKLARCYIVEEGSPEYPSQLAQIPNASRFLFLQGDVSLLTRSIVSIVGTRQPSDLGRWRAGKLAALLNRRGVIVASGLAKGIDGCNTLRHSFGTRTNRSGFGYTIDSGVESKKICDRLLTQCCPTIHWICCFGEPLKQHWS